MTRATKERLHSNQESPLLVGKLAERGSSHGSRDTAAILSQLYHSWMNKYVLQERINEWKYSRPLILKDILNPSQTPKFQNSLSNLTQLSTACFQNPTCWDTSSWQWPANSQVTPHSLKSFTPGSLSDLSPLLLPTHLMPITSQMILQHLASVFLDPLLHAVWDTCFHGQTLAPGITNVQNLHDPNFKQSTLWPPFGFGFW